MASRSSSSRSLRVGGHRRSAASESRRPSLQVDGTRSPVAREHVVGQREQRVALRAGRKRVERLLGALGELDRAAVGVVDRRVLLEQPQQLVPLLVGVTVRDAMMSRTIRDRRRRSPAAAGGSAAASPCLRAGRCRSACRRACGVAGEVEQVVDQLERDAEVEAVLAQRLFAARASTLPSMPPICAQPPNRYAVLRRMMSKCSSSVMSASPFLVS